MPVRIDIGALSRNYYMVTRIKARHLSICLNDHLDLVNHNSENIVWQKNQNTLKKLFFKKKKFLV